MGSNWLSIALAGGLSLRASAFVTSEKRRLIVNDSNAVSPLVPISSLPLPLSSSPIGANGKKGRGECRRSLSANDDGDDCIITSGESSDYCLSRLCELFGAEPTNLLSLRTDPNGVRGVYLNTAVQENDIILNMPLDACLRDDSPPDWLLQSSSSPEGDDDAYTVSVEGSVTRLTASLLDARHNKDVQSEAVRAWLELLPKNLRKILPIHWDDDGDDGDLLAGSGSLSLRLAVDSAYSPRLGPVGNIAASLEGVDAGPAGISRRRVEDALDLVLTRACRVGSGDGTPRVRVLVPVFDMINHDRDSNAEFSGEGDCLVVRAGRDIDGESEVLVDYGESTRPAWRCLFSYGFVPLSEDIYEDDVAEILLDDGASVEVGPIGIPVELIQYEAEKLGQYYEGGEVEFNPEIGRKIVDRIKASAKQLEASSSSTNDQQGSNDGIGSSSSIASQSVNDLRESNRRTLLACAGGLQEFIEDSI